MDPLSDVLRAVRLTGPSFGPVDASPPFAVSLAGNSRPSRPAKDAPHLVAYHIACHGEYWVAMAGLRPLRVRKGDAIVFPRGEAHVVTSDPTRTVAPGIVGAPRLFPQRHAVGAGSTIEAKFISGVMSWDGRPFEPLLRALPRAMYGRGLAERWLSVFPREVVRDGLEGRPGGVTMLSRMAEVMFIDSVRHHLESGIGPGYGWLAGLRDPVVGAALACIHDSPAEAWTVARLAREVSVSRTVLAGRFTEIVGMPPMQYLAQWRLHLASDLLSHTGAKVSAVGSQVGYGSEAAFSRAFKRATGTAPAEWRKLRKPA